MVGGVHPAGPAVVAHERDLVDRHRGGQGGQAPVADHYGVADVVQLVGRQVGADAERLDRGERQEGQQCARHTGGDPAVPPGTEPRTQAGQGGGLRSRDRARGGWPSQSGSLVQAHGCRRSNLTEPVGKLQARPVCPCSAQVVGGSVAWTSGPVVELGWAVSCGPLTKPENDTASRQARVPVSPRGFWSSRSVTDRICPSRSPNLPVVLWSLPAVSATSTRPKVGTPSGPVPGLVVVVVPPSAPPPPPPFLLIEGTSVPTLAAIVWKFWSAWASRAWTALLAARCESTQTPAAMIASARQTATALGIQPAITGSCCMLPSTRIGWPPAGVAVTWNGIVCGLPRHSGPRARTLTAAKPAAPGGTSRTAGETWKASRPSGSLAARCTTTGWLPRLSNARLWRANWRPCDVRGTSSAVVSANGRTSTTASTTASPPGSSREAALTANGTGPARTPMERVGWKVTRAVPSASGNSDSVGGSTEAHAAASPRTLKVNWSTTVPVLRTFSSQLTWAPGSTATVSASRLAVAPMRRP